MPTPTDWINLAFSGVVAISTVVYARLTSSLVDETKRMRRAQTEPALAVYVTPHVRHINLIELVIKNIGLGPAKEITWDLRADMAQLEKRKMKFHQMAIFKAIHFFPPGEEIRFLFGSANDLLGENSSDPLPAFHIIAKYKTASGEARSDDFLIDVSVFLGLSRLGAPPEYKIAESLERIEKEFAWLTSGMKRLKVLTQDEAQYVREVRREIALDRLKHKMNSVLEFFRGRDSK